MKFQARFLFICLSFSFGHLLFANPSNNMPPETTPVSAVVECPYLAPFNFHPLTQGTDYITMAWSQAGPPPPFYNLKTFEVSTGNLVSNVNFPNTQSFWTVTGLQPGTAYRFELFGYGPDCASPTVNGFGGTGVIDLMVMGFNLDPSNAALCAIPLPNLKCAFSGTGTSKFEIRDKQFRNISREFEIAKTGNLHYEVRRRWENENGFTLHCKYTNGGLLDPNCFDSYEINIKKDGLMVAKFKIEEDSWGNPSLFCTYLYSQDTPGGAYYPYEIILVYTTGGGGNRGARPTSVTNTLSGSEYSAFATTEAKDAQPTAATYDPISAALEIRVSPNPFDDQLEVHIPSILEEHEVNLKLYDLHGRLALEQTISGRSTVHRLETQTLQPGFYLLQVTAGNKSETIKVVKTQ